ncbi:hypothetical protein B0H13DRAFT_2339331 [Mycena leptocephala]|nr:hypothetical protein B0H13DRAFT_2339331 [Mycena leptocephala]
MAAAIHGNNRDIWVLVLGLADCDPAQMQTHRIYHARDSRSKATANWLPNCVLLSLSSPQNTVPSQCPSTFSPPTFSPPMFMYSPADAEGEDTEDNNVPSPHRGCSATNYIFKNQPHGQPIKGMEPTDFHHILVDELYCVLYRENYYNVYRGDNTPEDSCVVAAEPYMSDSDFESLFRSDCVITSSPSARAASLPPTNHEKSVPLTDLASSALDVANIDTQHLCGPLPTVSDFANGPPVAAHVLPHRPLTAWQMLPHAESSPTPGATATELNMPRLRPQLTETHRLRRKVPLANHPLSRKSQRQPGRVGAYAPGAMRLHQVQHLRVPLVAPSPNELRPVVDGNDRIVTQLASTRMRRLQRNVQLITAKTMFVRVGIDFGVSGQYPHPVSNGLAITTEVESLVASEDFRYITAYQDHLLQRFAPRRYICQALQTKQLARLPTPVEPAFPGSVFTTAEFGFGQPETDEAQNLRPVRISSGDHNLGRLWRRERMVPKGETRFAFQQYYNTAVGRWVQQGFLSNSEFADQALAEALWESGMYRQHARIEEEYAMMLHLDKLYV